MFEAISKILRAITSLTNPLVDLADTLGIYSQELLHDTVDEALSNRKNYSSTKEERTQFLKELRE